MTIPFRHSLLLMIFLFISFNIFAKGLTTLSFDTCRFSTDGSYALIYEYKYIEVNGKELPLYGLFTLGQNKTYDSLAINKDSVFFIKSTGSIFDFSIERSIKLNDFLANYKLFTKGIDITKMTKIKIDSTFIENREPRIEGKFDGKYLKKDYSDFYISYMLNDKIFFKDTLCSANTNSSKILELFNEERVVKFYTDSSLVGYRGYGTKIFSDGKNSQFFIRTKYIKENFTTKWETSTIEFMDPETMREEVKQIKHQSYDNTEIHVRRLVKNIR